MEIGDQFEVFLVNMVKMTLTCLVWTQVSKWIYIKKYTNLHNDSFIKDFLIILNVYRKITVNDLIFVYQT